MRRIELLVLAIVIASPVQAQRLDEASVGAQRQVSEAPIQVLLPRAPTVSSQTSASTRSMIVGGIIGGALGAVGGAMLGTSLEKCDRSRDSLCGAEGFVLGGILGEAIGVPIGVNWAAQGRGSKLKRTIPVSIGLIAGCLAAGGVLGIPVIPPLQIYTSIRTERSAL